MHNKKILAKGLILGALVSATSVNSMANYENEYDLLNINNSLNSLNKNKIKKENKIEKSIKKLKNNTTNSKEIIIVNENIIEGKVLEIELSSDEFIEDLSGNPEGYETVRVTTNGDKKLVEADYDKLRLSGIPKVDLSDAWSDSIPAGAFSNATHLTEFKFPQGIKSISLGASTSNQGSFYNCKNLTGSLTIPNSVTTIGNNAFFGCSGFTGNLTIGNSVTTIGIQTFYNCSGFTGDLTIPESVTTIGNDAFNNCRGFTGSLTIPNSVTTIGTYAFTNCSGFTGNLTIPNSVTTIGNYAFFGCSGFTGSLTIPNSVTTIGNDAFRYCSGFTGSLTIPNSVTTIGSGAFYGCRGFTGDLTIPNSVTSIGNSAFRDCSGFTGSLTIPESVTTIGQDAFSYCSGFDGNLVIGDSVKSIGMQAFQNCTSFTGNLVIPNSVTSIGNYAFAGCTNIEKILIKVDSSNIDSNYKESIITKLPDTSQVVIDIPYELDISGTWLETTNRTVGKPIIKNIVDETESNLINNKGEAVSLYIPSLYQESNISVLKDSENYILPAKNSEGKHIFIENGVYEVNITTDLGNTSIITFEVEDAQLRDARDAVDNVETSSNSIDLDNARSLVNSLPESLIKDQLQIRLNNILPNLTLERQTASSNLDLYIKSENMLLMNLSTNSITFEDFSGVNEIEKSSAIKISVNSSLPYQLNAYLLSDIKNTDGNNKIDIDRLNIKDNSEVSYSEFNDIDEKLVLKNDCIAGNDKEHIIDIKLKGDYAYPADIYKTVIKFEVEQK